MSAQGGRVLAIEFIDSLYYLNDHENVQALSPRRTRSPLMPLRRSTLITILALSAAVPLLGQSTRTIRTAVPVENNAPLPNPYMGWGLWAGPRYFDGRSFTLDYNTTGFGDDAPLFGWVLIDWMWSDLEPREGQYYWKDLDTVIDFWAKRHKQIELRVWITDDPGWNDNPGNEVCPEWLWAGGVKYRTYTGEAKSKKREPDYVDPSYEQLYLPKAKRLLSALAARYDKPDSPVTLWGAMGYGQWGEWHTMWSHYPWPNKDVKHAVLAKIVNIYADVFKVRPLVISYCFDDDRKQVTNVEDFYYRQALDVALGKGFALARHGFIDGLSLTDRQTMERYWRSNMMWAEGNWSYMDLKNEGRHGTIQENIEVFAEWHSNYGHFYMDAESYKRAMREDRAAFEDGLRSGGIGYRLVPLSVSWPEQLRAGQLLMMRSKWVNRNSGRCYVRCPLKLYLTDPDGNEKFSAEDHTFDQTGWLQGREQDVTTLTGVSAKLEPGVYDVRIALVDSSGIPVIRMPISGEDERLRYRIGTIRILPPGKQ